MDPVCYGCGKPIQPTENTAVDRGATYHLECWEKEQAKRRLPERAAV